MLLDVLARWNLWGTGRLPPGLARDVVERVEPFLEGPEVVALVGPRRAGKTTVLFQIIDRLLRAGVPDAAVLHVNLEEPLFAPLAGIELLERIYEAYREEIHPEGRSWVFLDEVQQLPEWERWVRARRETDDIKFFVTGSSSALMSRELGTLLTGRHVTFHVMPLNFGEYLRFAGIPVPANPNRPGRPRLIQNALGRFLRWGGFPEVALSASDERKEMLLKQYFEDVLYKDVALRHEVRDMSSLRSLAVQLLSQTASLVSFQRLARVLGTSVDLTRSYCRYLEEAFLLRFLPSHSLKMSERLRRPQKVHAVDTGLRNAVCMSGLPDLGRVAESATHAHLMHAPHDGLYYWRRAREVDFVVRRGTKVDCLVQVVHEGLDDPEVRKRELGGLREAGSRFRKARRVLVVGRPGSTPVTLDEEGVSVAPLWRFLLDLE